MDNRRETPLCLDARLSLCRDHPLPSRCGNPSIKVGTKKEAIRPNSACFGRKPCFTGALEIHNLLLSRALEWLIVVIVS